jgi:hypothetical protein
MLDGCAEAFSLRIGKNLGKDTGFMKSVKRFGRKNDIARLRKILTESLPAFEETCGAYFC